MMLVIALLVLVLQLNHHRPGGLMILTNITFTVKRLTVPF